MAGYVLAIPAHWAITSVGWRGALLGWSVVVIALVPAVWRAYPRRLGGRAEKGHVAAEDLRAVVVSPAFAALVVVFTIAPFAGYLATTQHAVYIEAIGFSAWEASAMLMVGGVLSTAGRALAGLACDRLGAVATGFASYGMTLAGALFLVALDVWPSRLLAYAYVVFIFFPLGTRATIVSMLVGRIASASSFGTIFGLLAIGNSLGAAAGPFLSGLIYDTTQSYRAIYVTAVGVVLVAIAALVVFVRTSRPRAS
jgi:predicted MFS family arabinose efflux permease